MGEDPVKLGLVASLARPGGNMTGINVLNWEVDVKRLALLHELVPEATHVAVLVGPATTNGDAGLQAMQEAAPAIGLQLRILNAHTSREIDAAFARFGRERPDAVFVGLDAFLNSRRAQLVNLASRRALPAIFPTRDIAEIGGLMSYGVMAARRPVYRIP